MNNKVELAKLGKELKAEVQYASELFQSIVDSSAKMQVMPVSEDQLKRADHLIGRCVAAQLVLDKIRRTVGWYEATLFYEKEYEQRRLRETGKDHHRFRSAEELAGDPRDWGHDP